LLLLIMISGSLFAQSANSEKSSVDFKPKGDPFVKIFSNFHYTTMDGNGQPAFEITRAYLGYEYFFSPVFLGKVNFDVGNPGVGKLEMTAYLKNAYLQYADGNVTVALGLIGTKQFKLQEKVWGYRYLLKSFMDEYKFGASADLGLSVNYNLAKAVSVDLTVLNGEGYKKLQSDSVLMYTAGITAQPAKNLWARIYVDYMKKDVAQSTYTGFLGYTGKIFTAAGEYNYQKGHGNVADHDYSGVSVYTVLKMKNHMNLFARFDHLISKKVDGAIEGWNVSREGQLYIAGMEFSPVKGIKISPNLRGWNPAQSGASFATSFYLNLEMKF